MFFSLISLHLCCTPPIQSFAQTVKSLITVVNALPSPTFNQELFQLIKRLASGPVFPMRAVCCSLFPVAYPRLQDFQEELLRIFLILAKDQSQVVRRGAVVSLADFVPVVDPGTVRTKFVPALSTFSQDERESIRLWVMRVVSACSTVLTPEDTQHMLLPIVHTLAQDQSWRVKYSVAESLPSFVASVKTPAIRGELVAEFVSLLRACSPLSLSSLSLFIHLLHFFVLVFIVLSTHSPLFSLPSFLFPFLVRARKARCRQWRRRTWRRLLASCRRRCE